MNRNELKAFTAEPQRAQRQRREDNREWNRFESPLRFLCALRVSAVKNWL